MIIIIIILLLLLVILYGYYKNKYNKLEEESYLAFSENKKKEIEELLQRKDEAEEELDYQYQLAEELLEEKKKEQQEVENQLKIKQETLSQIRDFVDKEYSHRLIDVEKKINDEFIVLKKKQQQDLLQEEINSRAQYELVTKQIQQKYNDLENDYRLMQETVADYKKKVDAINEENLRQEKMLLEQDVHRLILDENDKKDIQFLVSIIPNLRHPEILYKLIWSEYLIKPFQNMIKQSFGNKIPSNVIYCIENINNHKKYIGKTQSEVSKRWTEHIKTSLNIGGVSRSKIHDNLFLHWDEFTFTVLEVTIKEKLTEREKYYIKFYESDKYGYNIKVG